MIRLFFTKVSHYSRSIEEQREQKAILKKQKRCQSALGKGGRLEGNLTGIDSRARPKATRRAALGPCPLGDAGALRASTAERDRKAAAERRQRKEKGREVFLSSSRMIRRMVEHGVGDAQAWARKAVPFRAFFV